ncbi:MAG: hypothetical protein JXQ27_01625 [Acidobacteria bacterium]|nr:hypothetical protein [Acidobacteriota bacterium]
MLATVHEKITIHLKTLLQEVVDELVFALTEFELQHPADELCSSIITLITLKRGFRAIRSFDDTQLLFYVGGACRELQAHIERSGHWGCISQETAQRYARRCQELLRNVATIRHRA